MVLKTKKLTHLIQAKRQINEMKQKIKQKKAHDKKSGLVQLNFMQNYIHSLN